MSFVCYCCNEMVTNEKMVLVPTVLRQVKYRTFVKKARSSNLDCVSESEGLEIVKEVPIAESHSTSFELSNTPQIVNANFPKEVNTTLESPKFTKNNSR